MNDDLLKQIVDKLDGLDVRMSHFDNRLNTLAEQFESSSNALEKQFENRLNGLENHFENHLNALENHFENRSSALEDHFENHLNALESHFESRSNALENRMDRMELQLTGFREETNNKLSTITEQVVRNSEQLTLFSQVQAKQDKILEALALRSLEQEADIRSLKRA